MKLFNKEKNGNVRILTIFGIKIRYKKRKQEQSVQMEQIKPAEPLKTIECNICSDKSKMVFTNKLLNKYNVEYYFCYNCEHLQTKIPYPLQEAYTDAISIADTGILMRNYHFQELTANVIYNFFDKSAKFVEYAGGYGILTRLMRDLGFDFFWHDKYASNLFAKGFEYNNNEKVELITAFEVFEHLANPLEEIENMFKISDNILFSQTILPSPVPNPNDWWYYAPEGGQHISFYTNKTLGKIAQKYNKNYVFYNDLHLFTNKTINQNDFASQYLNSSKAINTIKAENKSKTIDDMYTCIEIMKRGVL